MERVLKETLEMVKELVEKKNKPEQKKLWHVNGWMIFKSFEGMSCTSDKAYIVMHPIYEGQYYEGFDTLEECLTFATTERFEKWHEDLS
jgi:hypothetical protein